MQNKELGIKYFNETWDLMDNPDRTPDQDCEMIHKAHASCFHWMLSSFCAPVNIARGEWQVSRVYSLLQMGESALYHAERSLSACSDNGISGLDLAFAFEAEARAYSTLNRFDKCADNLEKAAAQAQTLDAEDRDYILSELKTIKTH